MRLVDYYGTHRSKTWETKAEARRGLLLLNVKRLFKVLESYSLNRNVLGKYKRNETLPKKSSKNKNDTSSLQETEIIVLSELEVTFPPKKSAQAEILIMSDKMTERTAKKSCSGNCI